MRRHARAHALRRRYGRSEAPHVVYQSRHRTGATVWSVPGGSLQIMWMGPGSHLRIGYDFLKAGAPMGSIIDHPAASDSYNTRSEAEAAVKAFLAAK
jgi:hypothetical protein